MAAVISWSKKRKVFVVGCNKTGTTSMAYALQALGYRVGDQAEAELRQEDWAVRDFRRLVKYCRGADAFQDIPFSLGFTYQAMDQAFPDARFILTVRASPEEWYDSLVRFHTKILGKGRVPTAADLKEFGYRKKGWLWRTQELVFGIDEISLYDPDIYKRAYETHNRNVAEYFRHRPGKLLVLNLADKNSMEQLCGFLDLPLPGFPMPCLNRSWNFRETPGKCLPP